MIRRLPMFSLLAIGQEHLRRLIWTGRGVDQTIFSLQSSYESHPGRCLARGFDNSQDCGCPGCRRSIATPIFPTLDRKPGKRILRILPAHTCRFADAYRNFCASQLPLFADTPARIALGWPRNGTRPRRWPPRRRSRSRRTTTCQQAGNRNHQSSGPPGRVFRWPAHIARASSGSRQPGSGLGRHA